MTPTKKINFDALKRGLAKLQTGIKRALNAPNDEELRDACIQRFEYCFELCWKLLKRQLELELNNSEEVDSFSKKQLFRVAAEKGLISEVDQWFIYLEMRNLSSHTYNEKVAIHVFEVTPDFLKSATSLLLSLEKRND